MTNPTGRALEEALAHELETSGLRMSLKFSKTVEVWDEVAQAMKTVTVEIKIDEKALAKMLASRVMRSKSGKATMHGEIIVAKRRD